MDGVKHPLPGVVYPPAWHLEQYCRPGVLDNDGLAAALMRALKDFAPRTALVGPEGAMTYAELDDRSSRFACALLDLGLDPLDRVIFQVVNSTELVTALLACWKADLVPVCTLAAHRELEISQLAQHSGARAHFIGIADNFDFPAFARRMQESVASLEHTVVIRGEAPADLPSLSRMTAAVEPEAAEKRIATIQRDPFQVTVFQLSGGTTSVPKIIPRFGNEYLYNMQRVAAHNAYTKDDVALMALQIIHNASMVCFTFPLMLVGGTSVVLPKMDPASMFQGLLEHRPTIFMLSGAAMGRLRDHDLVQRLDLSRARMVVSANAARQIEEELQVPAVHIFGMTEGVITFSRPQDPGEARLGTVGQPVSEFDEVRIVTPGTTDELPAGQVGEMICRGPYTVFGYYDAEARNAEAFTSDGFYRSGDLMTARQIDGRTYLSFEGRIKDLVSRGGEKINCEEVEHLLRQHSAIHDVAIVPMPDPELEERACAFLILASEAAAPAVDELAGFLVGLGLAKYKCPEHIEIVDEFPLTSASKLDKGALKRAAEKLARSVD